MPSADVYAAAIVAACRLTGEDPLEFARPQADVMFKHYVVHAIDHVYAGVRMTDVAMALSVKGKASYFYRSSLWTVVGQGPHGTKPAHWWNPAVLDATIEAVRLAAGLPEPARALPGPTQADRPKAGPASSAEPQTPSAPKARPPLAADADPLTRRAVERGKSFDLLAEAAANTRKLQDSMPKDEGGE